MAAASGQYRSGHVLAGRYELDSIIGKGGHGLVWRAKDKTTGRLVAVKMLTDIASKDPQQVERLRREQIALSKLAGTAAVELIDLVQTTSGKLCLVMELLEGTDLEAHLEGLEESGQKIAVPVLLKALEPVVTTLERAHQQGIVHRDLKPANVFLLSEKAGGGVRLLDFGLARLRSALPLTALGIIVGSPSYIAPEVWKGDTSAADQRVDVYSFGVLVFRALSNQFPFAGVSLQDKFRAATSAERPSLHRLRWDLPQEIDEWVKQILAIDPDLRFRSLRGAWNALLAALGNPELARGLVTAEDLATAAAAGSPLSPLSTRTPDKAERTLPAAQPMPLSTGQPAAVKAEPSGALPALKAVFKRAAAAVVRTAEGVIGTDLLRSPAAPPAPVSQPTPSRPEPAFEPAPASVSIKRVVAVGGKSGAREGGSMVREWLAGTNLAVPAQPAEQSGEGEGDVVAWLSGEESADKREVTLPMGVRRPEAEPATERIPFQEEAPTSKSRARKVPKPPRPPARKRTPVPEAEALAPVEEATPATEKAPSRGKGKGKGRASKAKPKATKKKKPAKRGGRKRRT